MIRTGEVRKNNGQIQFSLMVLGTTQLRSELKLVDANPISSVTLTESISLALKCSSDVYPLSAPLACCYGQFCAFNYLNNYKRCYNSVWCDFVGVLQPIDLFFGQD
jgi:hypothetical protein